MNEINPFEKLSNDQVEELNRRLNPRVSNSLDGLVGGVVSTLEHARVFITTRQKMHKDGVGQFDELITKLKDEL